METPMNADERGYHQERISEWLLFYIGVNRRLSAANLVLVF
jgi:hypothetical protein